MLKLVPSFPNARQVVLYFYSSDLSFQPLHTEHDFSSKLRPSTGNAELHKFNVQT